MLTYCPNIYTVPITFEGPGPGIFLKGLLCGTILYFFGGLEKTKKKKKCNRLDFIA